ncbi:STRA6 protein, partial [Ptilonorhynchus violaceus]|nr:STRA6 protein [Ptilonorhynchus violaceus]
PFPSAFPGEIPDCHPTISPRMYHTCMAPISLAVLLGLSLLVKRRRLCRNLWNGVPGLLSPVNLLGEDGSRGPQLFLPSPIIPPLPFSHFPAFPHSRFPSEYWKLVALLYYPAFYYPLLACAACGHRLGYLGGSVLAWGHCLLHAWHRLQCPQSPTIYRFYSTLSHIPIILCLLLLSLWYPALLIRSFTGRQDPLDKQFPGRGYYRKYLKALLSKRSRKGSSTKLEESLRSRIRSYLRSYLYIPEEGFRIPLMLVVSVTVAVIAVYQVALLLLVAFVPTIQIIRAGMTKDIVVLLVQFGLVPSENPAVPGDMEKELQTVRHYLWSLEVCFVSSLALCCLLTFSMLLRTLSTHRRNLKALYQGAVLDVFSQARILRPSRQAVVCWMSFAGFQAAFACLGLLIQQVIFFLAFVAFAFLVVIPLQAGTGSLLFGIIRNMWPFWLALVSALILQHLAAHSQFLERNSLRKEITNRRALCAVTALLFPTNVLLGVVAGTWRLLLSGLYNSIHLCRLDGSFLRRGAESWDPGYHTYCQYLKVEVSQCHPLLRAFCFLLLQPGIPGTPAAPRDSGLEEGMRLMHPKPPAPGRARIQRIRARWSLAYTLVRNPSLAASRKSALSDPTANGAQPGPPKP